MGGGQEINGGQVGVRRGSPEKGLDGFGSPQTISPASTLSEAHVENALQECLCGSSACAWNGEDLGAGAAGLAAPPSLEMLSFPGSHCSTKISAKKTH